MTPHIKIEVNLITYYKNLSKTYTNISLKPTNKDNHSKAKASSLFLFLLFLLGAGQRSSICSSLKYHQRIKFPK